ncbi:MAG: response regulator [Desulfovibrionaceae bacterium]
MSTEKEDIRVLVVDDELEFLDLFLKRFGRRLAEVSSASSGLAALEALARGGIDVVVLDVKMPGMDGIETLKEIKKRYPGVEVILLTGHGSVESGIQGMTHGAYDYVMKPFEITDLLFKIKQANERRLLQHKA